MPAFSRHWQLNTLATLPSSRGLQVRDCGKMALLERLLNRLLPNGHKVLIFSQVRQEQGRAEG